MALIRGINVGGRNKVAMADLRAALESEGFGAVRTYIQSGNALFESDRPSASLEAEVEGALERHLGMPLVVVVRSHAELRQVVEKAPTGFGKDPDRYRRDAIFLKQPLSSTQAMRVVRLREDVDQAWPGSGVIYFSRLTARATQSQMGKIVGTPEYKQMTIRSWNTTTKLLALLDAET